MRQTATTMLRGDRRPLGDSNPMKSGQSRIIERLDLQFEMDHTVWAGGAVAARGAAARGARNAAVLY